jgi:hypothetical protein
MSTVEVTVIFYWVNFLGCLKPENDAADILAGWHNWSQVIPVLALFGSWTLDFRESECFLRGPRKLIEMNNYKRLR